MRMSLLVVVVISSVMTSCGSKESSSATAACATTSVLGTYTRTDGSAVRSLIIQDDCTFTEQYCGWSGTYPNVTSSAGTVSLTVSTKTRNDEICGQIGVTSCEYSLVGSVLSLKCTGSNTADPWIKI